MAILRTLRVSNYRALKSVELYLSEFTCIIGENNTGKSSVLLALDLFLTGSKLPATEYYDQTQSITVEGVLDGISERDLARLSDEHRERISTILDDGKLHLVRVWEPQTGKSTLRCRKLLPKDPRFHPENIAEIMRGKSGAALERAVKEAFPELAEHQFERVNQNAVRAAVDALIAAMPRSEKELVESELPTGIDASIKRLLPEPIYIPAVREISDEMKTRESATFGRIVGVLLSLVQRSPELDEIQVSFDRLRRLLNKVVDEATGELVDERIPQLVEIEKAIARSLLEHFPNTTLEIQVPPPEMKTIFAESRILVDDGIKDSIESKGDGLKRAVVFSLLRTYVELRARIEAGVELQPYLILFEEPELYLHPRGQRILFDALASIASDHQVVVTTHSPLFFGPEETGTFIRMEKHRPSNDAKPYSIAKPVQLHKDLSLRDAFQVICYENNAAAFFASKVVLVEGDSDKIFLTHVARTLKDKWNFERSNIAVVPIGGKGSVDRYHRFFSVFSIPIHVLVDLDALLDGFHHLPVPTESHAHRMREELITAIDEVAASIDEDVLTGAQIREMVSKRTWRERYERLKELAARIRNGESLGESEFAEVCLLFEEEERRRRLRVLSGPDLNAQKVELVRELAKYRVHVLLEGSIEQYYPVGCTGDKISRARQACNRIRSRQDAESLWRLWPLGPNNEEKFELEFVLERIFDDSGQVIER